MKRLCMAINLRNRAPVQWTNLDVRSLAVHDGTLHGADLNGVHEYGGDTDNGNKIYSLLRTPITDHGRLHFKRPWRALLRGRFKAQMELKVFIEDQESQKVRFPRSRKLNQRTITANLGAQDQGAYFQYELTNRDGGDFSLNGMEVFFIKTARSD